MPLAVFSMPPAPPAEPQPQPADLTAAAGMNALVLAIEAYVSTTATPMADACALKAVALTGRWLRQAVANGGDAEAHEQIACARFLADLAFESASRAGAQAQAQAQAQALAHRPGGPNDLPHAQARRRQLTARRLAEIARAMGEPAEGLDAAAAADLCLSAIYRLSADIGFSSGRASSREPYPHPAAAPVHALPDLPGLALHPEPVSQEEIQALFPGAT